MQNIPQDDSPWIELEPAGFIAVRRPSRTPQDWTRYRRLASERDGEKLWSARAHSAIELLLNEDIQEALYLASQGLYRRLKDATVDDLRQGKGRQLLLAFERYFARMCFRPTPFGTFSSIQFGTVRENATDHALHSAAGRALKKLVQLDHCVLQSVVDGITGTLAWSLRYITNASLVRRNGQYHYIDWSQPKPASRSYSMATIDAHPAVQHAVDFCRGEYRTPSDIVEAIRTADHEIPEDVAVQLVRDLIEARVVTSNVTADPLADDPRAQLIDVLADTPGCDDFVVKLRSISSKLAEAQACTDQRVQAYEEVDRAVRRLVPQFPSGSSLRVDTFSRGDECWVSDALAREVSGSLARLMSKLAQREGSLDEFCSYFKEHYGQSTIPLLDILEDDALIEASERLYSSPILTRLSVHWRAKQAGDPPPLRKFDRLIVGKLLERRADHSVIEIADEDLANLPHRAGQHPAEMFAILSLPSRMQRSSGDENIYVHGISNRESAGWLGRFSNGDAELRKAIDDSAQQRVQEEADVIHAELSYLPSGQMGNILNRPLIWPYRINLVESGPRATKADIPLSDLLVRVVGSELQVWSRTMKKRVIPHMTTAHNVGHPGNVKAYRLLRAVELHGKLFSHFGWGGAFREYRFLPRIKYRNLVLAPARWHLDATDLRILRRSSTESLDADILQLLTRLGVPQIVELKDGDNTLLLDMADELDRAQLWRSLKAHRSAILTESYAASSLDDPEHRHELILPFRVQAAARQQPPQAAVAVQEQQASRPSVARDLVSASMQEVVYFKIYASPAEVDELLQASIPQLLARLRSERLIRDWFFIRYSDPKHHLRIRFFVRDGRFSDVISEVVAHLEAGDSHGERRRLEICEYEREIERYGGLALMGISEELFCIDSDLALQTLCKAATSISSDGRWKLAVIACCEFLEDLPFLESDRLSIAKQLSAAYRSEFGISSAQRTLLGQEFRLGAGAFMTPAQAPIPHAFEREALRKARRAALTGVATAELTRIAGSHLHMICNRLLIDNARAYEVLIHDTVERIFRARAGRAMSQSS